MNGFHEDRFFEPLYLLGHSAGVEDDPCDNCGRQFRDHHQGTYCPLPEDEITSTERSAP